MKSFYSILYVPLRPEAKEILSLGLLMRDDKQAIFRYSKDKLSVLKELLPKDAYHLLKLSLQSIERAVLKANSDFNYDLKTLWPPDEIQSDLVAEPYIKYLSVYSKNLITFASPEYISVPVTFDLFKKLFGKLIYTEEAISEKNEPPEDIVIRLRALLIPKIKDRVNIEFSVTPDLFNKLIIPSIKVDFIGKNGQYVTGQMINFQKKESFLEADVTKQITLFNAMHGENGGGKCFILGKEPNKKYYPVQHSLWKNVSQSSFMEFVDADEYESVSEYIQEHDVKPLI